MNDRTSPGERVDGRLVLFGHAPTPGTAYVFARSRRWRTLRAVRTGAMGVLLAPLIGLVPPHAPWALGALVGGLFLARRKLQERHTLMALEGPCPRCEEALSVAGPTRLRSPHPVPCESCHHESGFEASALPDPSPAHDGDAEG